MAPEEALLGRRVDVTLGVAVAVVVPVVGRPPQRALLRGRGGAERHHELPEPVEPVAPMGEVAVVAGGDEEHPPEVEGDAQHDRRHRHAGEDGEQRQQVQQQERDRRHAVDPLVGPSPGRRRGGGVFGTIEDRGRRRGHPGPLPGVGGIRSSMPIGEGDGRRRTGGTVAYRPVGREVASRSRRGRRRGWRSGPTTGEPARLRSSREPIGDVEVLCRTCPLTHGSPEPNDARARPATRSRPARPRSPAPSPQGSRWRWARSSPGSAATGSPWWARSAAPSSTRPVVTSPAPPSASSARVTSRP